MGLAANGIAPGSLLQWSSERARIAALAIVSKGVGDRCKATVAVSTRFTATIA